MQIRNVVHDALRRFISEDDATGLDPAVAKRVRRIVSFLQDMERKVEIGMVPGWRARPSTGGVLERLSVPVTERCRLTFWIDNGQTQIVDLDCIEGR
jgi:proteic killer suppression protein